MHNPNLLSLRKNETISTSRTFYDITAFFKNVSVVKDKERLSYYSRQKENKDDKQMQHMILSLIL